MRRSAAPSQSSVKRLKFLSPLQNSIVNKENDILSFLEPEIAENYKLLESNQVKQENEVSLESISPAADASEIKTLRSTSDVLKLITETADGASSLTFSRIEHENSEVSSASCGNETVVKNRIPTFKVTSENDNVGDITKSNDFSSNSENFVAQYNVLWCKRSGKKHKIWEGDGVLTVRNRTAILKNSEGKEIDRGIGYKWKDVSSLEEGSKFIIGGKECEIQSLLSSEVLSNDERSENIENAPSLGICKKTSFKSKKHTKPSKNYGDL